MTESHTVKSNASRITELEKDMEIVSRDVKSILQEHLPKLKLEVNTLATLMKVYGSLIIAGITALIIMGLKP
jgi:hypothetical protein